MARYVLAEKLGKTQGELAEMPHAEFIEWIAYLRLRATKTQ